MYKGFNLSFGKNFFQFMKQGEELSTQYRTVIMQKMDAFLTDDGKLDGSRLQEHWFPQVHADVFISHSHNDLNVATALAGWLFDSFGLKPFMDSCVWGCADDLLKRIDKKYCRNPDGETYSYSKRNGSTSHIHMMLSTALGMMIDSTECLLFLNTPNSISSEDAVLKTQSPWLFMEIAMSRIIRRKSPDKHRHIMTIDESLELKKIEAKFTFEYKVNLASLTNINWSTLMTWKSSHVKGKEHPLDTLYRISKSLE
jgi:hypothetical protein